MTNTPTFRGTWTYAAGAVHVPRSIFRKLEPEPVHPVPPQPAEATPAPAPAYAPTPERYMSETDFVDLRTAILTALLPHPEARVAILNAMRPSESRLN